MFLVASADISSTSTLVKRRINARSFSKCLRYSSYVVDPMQWIDPRAKLGLNIFAASIAPVLPAPAPMI